MRYEFQKWTEEGELCNRYTTLEELTSEMKGKNPPHRRPPHPPPSAHFPLYLI